MKRFTVDKETYERIVQQIKTVLLQQDIVLFAYLHGSFIGKTNFGDVDVAVYLKDRDLRPEEYLSYELMQEHELESVVDVPVDIRVLNNAPPAFCYNVIKNGQLLFEKNEQRRVDFEVLSFKLYFDFLPYRKRYLEEALYNGPRKRDTIWQEKCDTKRRSMLEAERSMPHAKKTVFTRTETTDCLRSPQRGTPHWRYCL